MNKFRMDGCTWLISMEELRTGSNNISSAVVYTAKNHFLNKKKISYFKKIFLKMRK